MTRFSTIRPLALLFIWLSWGCKSYNLERASFPVCVKPSASITYTVDHLEATFSLTNRQGGIDAVGWDLGNGQHKTGERIKVAYGKSGVYTITVVLANTCNDTFTTSRSIIILN